MLFQNVLMATMVRTALKSATVTYAIIQMDIVTVNAVKVGVEAIVKIKVHVTVGSRSIQPPLRFPIVSYSK